MEMQQIVEGVARDRAASLPMCPMPPPPSRPSIGVAHVAREADPHARSLIAMHVAAAPRTPSAVVFFGVDASRVLTCISLSVRANSLSLAGRCSRARSLPHSFLCFYLSLPLCVRVAFLSGWRGVGVRPTDGGACGREVGRQRSRRDLHQRPESGRWGAVGGRVGHLQGYARCRRPPASRRRRRPRLGRPGRLAHALTPHPLLCLLLSFLFSGGVSRSQSVKKQKEKGLPCAFASSLARTAPGIIKKKTGKAGISLR